MLRRSEAAVERTVGPYVLLFPLARSTADVSHVFSLEGVGAYIWKRLDEPATLDALVEAVLDAFDVEPDVARREVGAFVADLQEAGLVQGTATR